MIDVRRTLENLHQILPNLSIEDLFRVLDNIVEIPQFNLGQFPLSITIIASPVVRFSSLPSSSYTTVH